MRSSFQWLAAGLCAALSIFAFIMPAAAQDALSPAARDEVREIIREYLLENPELIEEAIIELQRRRENAEIEFTRTQVRSLSKRIFEDERDVVIGPADAPLTLVEFFDYNCGFCRASTPFLRSLLETHGDQIRIIFKETPVLGAGSREAARWAVAAKSSDQYLDAHFALMDAGERLDGPAAAVVLREAGIDVARIEPARSRNETTAQLDDSVALLQEITNGQAATPTFIVNGEVVTGADFDTLTTLIDQELNKAP